MKVTVMRIDDRLIHGQIVTRWIDYAENLLKSQALIKKVIGRKRV